MKPTMRAGHIGMMLPVLAEILVLQGTPARAMSFPVGLHESGCSAFVDIAGNSNINHFELNLNFPAGQAFRIRSGTVSPSVDQGQAPEQDDVYRISIPVRKFQTSNKLIYNDFIRLLKVDEYPDIVIEIPYEHLRNIFSGIPCMEHQIRITIAGVTRSYYIPSYSGSCSGNKFYVTGYQILRLSDFGLNPPSRFNGLIRVDEDVSIDFNFVFAIGTVS